MSETANLYSKVLARFEPLITGSHFDRDEITLIIPRENLREVCLALRDENEFAFDLLVDICGIDYLHYGRGEWETQEATLTGFSRGSDRDFTDKPDSRNTINAMFNHEPAPVQKPRFATVYHLLSLTLNHRIRLRVMLKEEDLTVPSVMDIWPAADWFEREAFDLFGIPFKGHPDLRRILTDYGFIGHPFRKDFPLIGNVEIRYDAKQARIVYEPVSITPRILEPKVIREDNRYEVGE